ncbi:hypothetical protein ONE63_005597 [Megalurothrips usitatus]|uniref:MutS protein homolog 4-like n=1 Tax=Megalurothrips usitatus TaxID=439358 RepID=A0AAV7XW22_9NEOP|nr:hypothetical protein ONE63_005597 [Megalurothrips usitatus]
MAPPKTPHNTITPKNSIVVSSTPRTTPSTSAGHDAGSQVILAVTEGRGHARGEVGIAVIDVKRPRLILCQLSDGQTYANALMKISVFRPVEILVPHTFVDTNQPNKLYNLLEEKFAFVSMTKVQRRLFRDSEGLEKVQSLCLPEYSSCQLILKDRFYALAAAAALLKYVEFVQNVIFAAHSLKVEYQGAHHGTIIDVKTATNLELILNQQSNNTTHSLVGIMDHCCTHGGSRLLRASLIHPPCSLPTITRRQDGVQELVENPDISKKIREILQQLPDVEQLLTLCMQTPSTVDSIQAMESRVNYVLMLKTTLETLPHLAKSMEEAKSILFIKSRECLQDSRGDLMKSRISQTLNEDVKAPKGGKTATFQRCFAVKSGINELMDVARKTYCELISDMHDHVLDVGAKYALPLKMNYSVTKGYHIQITSQKNNPINKSDLPSVFVQVQHTRNSITCTTDSLILANARIEHVTNDILTLSNTLLAVILNDIRKHIGYLYEMCESIAEVDLILSLAQISCSHNYVRPHFGEILCLKASRHPILESITTCDPIANDIEATKWQNLTVITGPNMSGKSIYIRQVLLLQIMAQVGSYVPADQATFRITDRIFSHLNFDDSIENNASTLSLEMKEMQLVLSNITATSLVALDELCRGTSVEEGTALAWAFCEELSQSTAFVFVTTHFRELNRLASLYPCIKNVHLETVENTFADKKSRLVYTHRLLPGANPVENYGLRLAENLDVPETILKMAKMFASQIQNTSKVTLTSAGGDKSYTLALGFHKLKTLVCQEDICVNDLILLQSELKEALKVVQQKEISRKKASLVPLDSNISQIHSSPLTPRKLCDYSSSDHDSPIVTPVSKRELPMSAETKSPLEYQCSESHSMLSSYRMESSSDAHSPKLSMRSGVIDNDSASSTSSVHGSEHFSDSGSENFSDSDTLSRPMSSSSHCSHDTWIVENPMGQSIVVDKTCETRKGQRKYSDISESEFGKNRGEVYPRPGASIVSDVCEDSCVLPNTTLGSFSITMDDTSDGECNLFPKEIQAKSLNASFEESNQQPPTDFFSNISSVPNLFKFLCKTPAEKNCFETLFTNVENMGNYNTPMVEVIKGTCENNTHKKRCIELEEACSPILVPKVPRSENQLKKTRSFSALENSEKKVLVPAAPILPVKPQIPIARDAVPTSASQASTANTTVKPSGNALDALMDSYCFSDSDSD